MLVKVLGSGRVVTALHVGAGNVRQCFPKQIPSIEFELDHLRVECELARDFWKRQPEIRDCRLCLWLKFKFLRAGSVGISTLLAMIPTGLNLYKLELANINGQFIDGQYFPRLRIANGKPDLPGIQRWLDNLPGRN